MSNRDSMWRGDSSASEPFAEQRRQMMETQLVSRGIQDSRVLEAMSEIPREDFLPHGLRQQAYADAALPIDNGQTISQPYTVAFMCQALGLKGGEKLLEIGTGSGYGAAVLSRLAREVHSVERLPELAKQARDRLERRGYTNVNVHIADGSLGLPDESPFDAIIVTAAAERLPAPYQDQLAEGGRIVLPLGPRHHSQFMYRFTQNSGRLHCDDLGAFVFVPLIGTHGFEE